MKRAVVLVVFLAAIPACSKKDVGAPAASVAASTPQGTTPTTKNEPSPEVTCATLCDYYMACEVAKAGDSLPAVRNTQVFREALNECLHDCDGFSRDDIKCWSDTSCDVITDVDLAPGKCPRLVEAKEKAERERQKRDLPSLLARLGQGKVVRLTVADFPFLDRLERLSELPVEERYVEDFKRELSPMTDEFERREKRRTLVADYEQKWWTSIVPVSGGVFRLARPAKVTYSFEDHAWRLDVDSPQGMPAFLSQRLPTSCPVPEDQAAAKRAVAKSVGYLDLQVEGRAGGSLAAKSGRDYYGFNVLGRLCADDPTLVASARCSPWQFWAETGAAVEWHKAVLCDAVSAPWDDVDCQHLEACTRFGRCTFENGECRAASDADCRRAKIKWADKLEPLCAREGKCGPLDGACAPRTDADCVKSTLCRTAGRCSKAGWLCTVRSDKDCKSSELCRTSHYCEARAGTCQQ